MKTRNIKVSPASYLVFYEVFHDHFIEIDLKGVLEFNNLRESPEVWAQKNKKGQIISLEIFGGEIGNPIYFQKKRNSTILGGSNVSVSAEALSKALLHLGCKLEKEKDPLHSKEKAELRFGLFKKKYDVEIKQIEKDEQSLSKNKIRPELIDRILNKAIPGREIEVAKGSRYDSLNAKFAGVHIQNKKKDSATLELFTGKDNCVTGFLSIKYQKDEYHDGGTQKFQIISRFFSDSILRCIYWNEDLSIPQHGYVDFTLSTDKNWLIGNFMGFYEHVPNSRQDQSSGEKNKVIGTLTLKRIKTLLKTK